jgi:putative addiction module component (TIGR02574 family)
MSHGIDISRLTPAERILLAEHLWDSVAADAQGLALTPAQQEELDHRLAAADHGQVSYSSWPEAKARLLPKE